MSRAVIEQRNGMWLVVLVSDDARTHTTVGRYRARWEALRHAGELNDPAD